MSDATLTGAVPGIPGASYRTASLPGALQNAIFINPWTQVADGKVLLHVPGVARYMMEGGVSISIHAEKDADPSSVDLFLKGPARGYLIHQRGEVPLEAATVIAPNGAAVALSSLSGMGNSTLAAELCRRGWRLVADGITRITFTAGRMLAWPSHDKVILWRSACESFGMDLKSLQQVRPGMEKYYVPMPAARGSAPLRTVVRLVRGETVARIETLAKGEILPSLQRWQYRWPQIEPLLAGNISPTIARMAEACQVVNITGAREKSPFELADIVTRVVQ